MVVVAIGVAAIGQVVEEDAVRALRHDGPRVLLIGDASAPAAAETGIAMARRART